MSVNSCSSTSPPIFVNLFYFISFLFYQKALFHMEQNSGYQGVISILFINIKLNDNDINIDGWEAAGKKLRATMCFANAAMTCFAF